MLAQANAIAGFDVHPKVSCKYRLSPPPLRFACVSFWNNGIVKCTGGIRRVVVSAAYTRMPMDVPGAYQLVDDVTGNKFIIWGGTEDDKHDPHTPSEEALSWKPNPYNSRSSRNDIASRIPAKSTEPRTARGGEFIRSFGRLKTQRVGAFVRKTSLIKQTIDGSDQDEQMAKPISSQASMTSHCHSETLENNLNLSKNRGDPLEAAQSQDTRFIMQNVATGEGMDHCQIATEQGSENLSKFGTRSTKYLESGCQIAQSDVSISKYSAAFLKGWGNRELMTNVGSKAIDTRIRLQKFGDGNNFFSRKTFRDLGCCDYMIESLRDQLIIQPSHIQAMAFTPITSGKSCIIADQSGSGKTLAYLVPVIQRLREEELHGSGKSLPKCPRVVVLVPTAELASQVLSNCRLISKFGVPFRSMVATGGFRQRTQLENLQHNLDVLIATPGRFMFLFKEGFLQLTNLICAILDEVDVLFKSEGFEPALQSLIKFSPVTTQYLFVTATLPIDICNKVLEVFPDSEVIMGPGMHRTSPGLEEVLVDCSGDDKMEKTPDSAFANKMSALLHLSKETRLAKTIIFCNKIETCRKVENAIKRSDKKGSHMRVLPFHAALAKESRLANMEKFRCSQSKDSSFFLVSTDRASRGIDFADVANVVLFDFPRDPSEYVRRVGRTARGAGGKGKAFIFAVGKQVSLAKKIIERNRKGHPLHEVPSSFEYA